MRSHLLDAVALAAAVSLASAPGDAQGRRSAPTGAEIAAKAKAVKLDRANAGVGQFQGQRMAFTPAVLPHVKSLEDIKAGQVIGVLENGAVGDETGLPPGTYRLFLAEVDGQWRAYAESNGEIVREAIRANIGPIDPPPVAMRPLFRERGWCWSIPYCWFLGCSFDLPAITICF